MKDWKSKQMIFAVILYNIRKILHKLYLKFHRFLSLKKFLIFCMNSWFGKKTDGMSMYKRRLFWSKRHLCVKNLNTIILLYIKVESKFQRTTNFYQHYQLANLKKKLCWGVRKTSSHTQGLIKQKKLLKAVL